MRPLILITAVAAFAQVRALPVTGSEQECADPPARIEWRELDPVDQKGYIDAVLCLKTKPSRIGLDTPLYDDFAYVHFTLAQVIHGYAVFLPWHRYFTHIYFEALQTECGYTGPFPYWDWTKDVLKLRESPVMSADHGFGGDGSETRTETLSNGRVMKCVDSGPFAGLRPAYYAFNPQTLRKEEHCLTRSMTDGDQSGAAEMAAVYNATYVNETVQASPAFDTYAWNLEGGPHGVIHASIDGDLGPSTSPNEPLFFLHHAQVDRLWWLWQQADPAARDFDFTGQKGMLNSTTTALATLDDTMQMLGLAGDLAVRDVMTTRNSRLCYKY